MRCIVKPEYGARVRGEYIVIGHWDVYSIIRKTDRSLHFILDVNHVLSTGTYVTEEGLKPISKLPADIYLLISDLCAEVV